MVRATTAEVINGKTVIHTHTPRERERERYSGHRVNELEWSKLGELVAVVDGENGSSTARNCG
jgi:hypothetical protein